MEMAVAAPALVCYMHVMGDPRERLYVPHNILARVPCIQILYLRNRVHGVPVTIIPIAADEWNYEDLQAYLRMPDVAWGVRMICTREDAHTAVATLRV